MTYRDPAPVQCETCMNKKTRSPRMPMKSTTKSYLFVMVAVVVACLLVFADIATGIFVNGRYGYEWAWAVCLPFTIMVIGFVTATATWATE